MTTPKKTIAGRLDASVAWLGIERRMNEPPQRRLRRWSSVGVMVAATLAMLSIMVWPDAIAPKIAMVFAVLASTFLTTYGPLKLHRFAQRGAGEAADEWDLAMEDRALAACYYYVGFGAIIGCGIIVFLTMGHMRSDHLVSVLLYFMFYISVAMRVAPVIYTSWTIMSFPDDES